jgi:hypothetical protein
MGMFDVPRCQHVKVNGTQCGSPALQGGKLCFFHKRAREQRARTVAHKGSLEPFVMPLLEDANAVQMALMQVMQLLALGRMDHDTARLLLYSLQIASSNLARIDFNPWVQDVVTHPKQLERTQLKENVWQPGYKGEGDDVGAEFEDEVGGDSELLEAAGEGTEGAGLAVRRETWAGGGAEARKRIRVILENAAPQIVRVLEETGEARFRLKAEGEE